MCVCVCIKMIRLVNLCGDTVNRYLCLLCVFPGSTFAETTYTICIYALISAMIVTAEPISFYSPDQ